MKSIPTPSLDLIAASGQSSAPRAFKSICAWFRTLILLLALVGVLQPGQAEAGTPWCGPTNDLENTIAFMEDAWENLRDRALNGELTYEENIAAAAMLNNLDEAIQALRRYLEDNTGPCFLTACTICENDPCTCVVVCQTCFNDPCTCVTVCQVCFNDPCTCVAVCQVCFNNPCTCTSVCQTCFNNPCSCITGCQTCFSNPCTCSSGCGN